MSVQSLAHAQRCVVFSGRLKAPRIVSHVIALTMMMGALALVKRAELDDTEFVAGVAWALMSLVILGLGIWARWRPFPAILSALILFLTFHVDAVIQDPERLFPALLLKIAAITLLIRGVSDSYALRDLGLCRRKQSPPDNER